MGEDNNQSMNPKMLELIGKIEEMTALVNLQGKVSQLEQPVSERLQAVMWWTRNSGPIY